MRWFLIPAVATTALVLADPTPVRAQITIGGYPTYSPPYGVRFAPPPGVPTPAGSGVLPNSNGGLVNFAVDDWLRTLGSTGYGPYAGNYAPFAGPRYNGFVNPANYVPGRVYQPLNGFVNPANYVPGRVYQPLNVPAANGKWVAPRSGNPGLHRGWFKGKGR
jgi:hypothetical protein